MNKLSESVTVITGAAGALGSAAAKRFYDAGARLALLDRHKERLEEEWNGAADVLCLECDITRSASVKEAVERITGRFGRIDILLNIAGGFAMGTPVHEASEESWNAMLDLNAKSVFLVSGAVIPFMRRQKNGRIVNMAAKTALHGNALLAPYIVSKSAVIRLTESLAEENKREGIRVNCLLPSIIDTPANRKAMPDADFSAWVSPDAITDVLLFLVSDASRAINGASIPVYGLS